MSNAPLGRPLGGVRVCVLTTVHTATDVRIFYKEALSLAAAGCHVTVIGPWEGGEQPAESVRIRGIQTRRTRWQRFALLLPALRLALRTHADIYHIHDPELLVVAPVLRMLSGKPVVYDVHEYYPEAIIAKDWIPGPLRRHVSRAYVVLERLVYPFLAGFVHPTPDLVDLYRWAKRPHVLVANFAPARHYLDPDTTTPRPPVAVFVGSLSRTRAIDVLLEAMPRLLARCSHARLLLIGTATTKSYQEELQRRARELGVSESVEFRGWVPFPLLREAMSQAYVGVALYLPIADMGRGWPTKVFEYMAAGLPVITADLPNCRAIVEGAGCGLAVDSRDAAAVADALAYLFEHPAEAAEMGRRGRRGFLARYTWEGEAAKLVGLYARLLHRRPRRDEPSHGVPAE